MKRIDKFAVFLMAVVLAIVPAVAMATPAVNGTVVIPRIFNDCPGSLESHASSLTDVHIQDLNPNCFGFANLHVWRFSADGGATAAQFANGDAFRYCADLTINGTGEGEAGLQIPPWWNNDEGRFNCRTTDGEIACFGGRLPFFSFTGAFGLHYLKGTPIHLEITYLPNGLSQASPATIEYRLTYMAVNYTSGPLPFDQGNPAEDPPHGQWGILTPAYVGGHMQYFLSAAPVPNELVCDWNNICFEALDVIPVESTTWGNIKALYK